MKKLSLPLTIQAVENLRCGEVVALSGIMYTARDAVHKYLSEGGKVAMNLEGGVFYHCGPVTIMQDGKWQITAAGPTTSMREEDYMASIIEKFKIRAIIGKGGMGKNTLKACNDFKCVYLSAYGGCAQLLADCIKEVSDVYFYDEFGAPEAMWKMVVEDFPAVVTMDAHGNSLHEQISEISANNLKRLLF